MSQPLQKLGSDLPANPGPALASPQQMPPFRAAASVVQQG